MITILGPGAVGLTLAARLAATGQEPLLVTRRRGQAEALERDGAAVEDPASGRRRGGRVAAACGIDAARSRIGAGPVLVCVRASDTRLVAPRLAAAAPDAVVASLQNDLDNEETLAAHFGRVLGGIYRQTCTRTSDTTTLAVGDGRIVLGAHTAGPSPSLDGLASLLREAGYDVGVTSDLPSDRWLKLCTNLMSAPNALVRREDHETGEFVELKARLLEEARDVLAAAAIRARSCDGRDRSLDEEIRFQRESLARGQSARRLPIYNQVWNALRHGGPLEADGYHRRLLRLAARFGQPVPHNARVLRLLEEAYRLGHGPESLTARALLGS